MNRRGFLRSLTAGIVTAAAVTRLGTARLEIVDEPLSEKSIENMLAEAMQLTKETLERNILITWYIKDDAI